MRTLEESVLKSLRSLDKNYNHKTYLLAVSGGSDSVCLFHVFKALGLRFDVAHCNFNLRGEESEGDEMFVRNLLKDHTVNGYFTTFQTEKYAKEKRLSIQEAARKLRYDWFAEVVKKQKIDYVVTAHHQDDLIETFFINLTRGTGVAGLKGIPKKSRNIIRPMLTVSKEEVEDYLGELQLNYRHDSSNDSLKYSRNFLRHKIIPELDHVHNNAKKGMLATVDNLNSIEEYLSEKLKEDEYNYVEENEAMIQLKELASHSFYFVFHVLSRYGFTKTQVENVIKSTQKGRLFYSNHYRLLKENNQLLIKRNNEENLDKTYSLATFGRYKQPIELAVEVYQGSVDAIVFNENIAWMDASKVRFPLILRRWKEGDCFQPLGLKGKKKLSDFFTDLKLNQFEKEAIWVLESQGEICWVVGKRLGDGVKITANTTKIIKIVTKL